MGPFSSQFWYPYGSKFFAWSANAYPLPEEPNPNPNPNPGDAASHVGSAATTSSFSA